MCFTSSKLLSGSKEVCGRDSFDGLVCQAVFRVHPTDLSEWGWPGRQPQL